MTVSIETEDPNQLLADALAWIEQEPDSADAHYEAALAYEDLDREAERVREMLTVLKLDSRSDLPPFAGCDEIVALALGWRGATKAPTFVGN